MMQAFWNPENSRKIRKRIMVKGTLLLETPVSFSNGDTEDLVDIPLLTDAIEPHRPLLTGASLAGALRSYISGFGGDYAELLFGGKQSQEDGEQSPLIIEDAVGHAPAIELRDGVRIDPKSRTASDKALYNRELWSAGTTFDLQFELLISPIYFEPIQDKPGKPKQKVRSEAELTEHEQKLRSALTVALEGLANGNITLGGRKTRGYGRGSVKEWLVQTYDMSRPQDLKAWIENTAPPIASTLDGQPLTEDRRSQFEIKAMFALDGSLLIRTEGGAKNEPDMVHLRARQGDGTESPILPGTSLAGALRARAFKIASTLGLDAKKLTDGVFGADMEEIKKQKQELKKQKVQGARIPAPHASRLRVSEQVVKNAVEDLVQSRVSIDRFTGGAMDTALFNEQPLFSRNADTTLDMTLVLKRPDAKEIGLLLLLLKDLWTSDLPLGGEASVGRGRLKGIKADLTYRKGDASQPQTWEIKQGINGRLILPENAGLLEDFVEALRTPPAPDKAEKITETADPNQQEDAEQTKEGSQE